MLQPVDLLLLSLVLPLMVSQCVLGAPFSDVNDGGGQEERWLADESFYDFQYEDEKSQADGREVVANNLCPPVPTRLPVRGCDVYSCSSDRECADRHLKCCYNGCVYTCLPEVKPPPYFDWIREPVRRLQFGQSWLVPGPNLQMEAMLCSTNLLVEDDSDPLICPHGYECSIDDVGRPAEGIPNRGHCVKVTEDVTTESTLSSTLLNQANSTTMDSAGDILQDTASMHACQLDEQKIILSGHSINLEGRNCLCQERILTCDEESLSPIR